MSAKKRFTTLQEWELAKKKYVFGNFFSILPEDRFFFFGKHQRADSHFLENAATFFNCTGGPFCIFCKIRGHFCKDVLLGRTVSQFFENMGTFLQKNRRALFFTAFSLFSGKQLRVDSHFLENTGTFLKRCLIREDRLTIFGKRYVNIVVKKVPPGKQSLKVVSKM